MAIGKYRYKRMWYDSKKWGVHEKLMKEGVAAGRSWAVLRRWRPNPRYTSERGESYVLRVDLSEFFTAYFKCANSDRMYETWYRILRNIGKDLGDVKPARIRMENCSPGWWENGFNQQLCLESTMFHYDSDADKFEKVVKTGRYWDMVDYDDIVAKLCLDLAPLFDMMVKEPVGSSSVPEDDF